VVWVLAAVEIVKAMGCAVMLLRPALRSWESAKGPGADEMINIQRSQVKGCGQGVTKARARMDLRSGGGDLLTRPCAHQR